MPAGNLDIMPDASEIVHYNVPGLPLYVKEGTLTMFSKYLGQTPFDFLISYRLEVSCNLLGTTGRSISEIAAACGFNNSSYFARMFQKRYGVKPSVYRKANRQMG